MTKYLPSFDELTDSQKELATEKLKRIESAILYHKATTLKDKYFPYESSFCYDNIGSWFAVHRNNQMIIRCICHLGGGLMLNYDTVDGPAFMDGRAIKKNLKHLSNLS